MVRRIICFGVLVVLAVLLMAGTLCIGPVDLDSDMFATVLWKLRVPRLVAAVFAGAALSVSGLSLQTLFRNPLAGPFVLGISNGSSFGVALALLAGFSFGNFGVLTAASLGALTVTAVILWIASKFERNSVLLVAGLLIGYFIDALVSLLIAGSDAESLRMYISWGMGSFGRLTPSGIWIFTVAVGVGLLLIVSCLRYLNGARLGDEFARGLGLSVAVQKKCVLLGASILAAAVTAFCGPVAFIGIAVPHLTYLLFRTTNHRVLIPGVMLCGADLALLAGLFPTIPLNATLSIVGVPVILWVLLRSGREGRL